jgi:DNA topoisomerase-1
MSKALVIVESPAKAKTLGRYLGKDFDILASYGHVRDLMPKTGAIDTDNGFSMHYQIIEKNARRVDDIARALKKAETLYLATDPDREGEAISWHLYELLKERGVLDGKKVHRVVFHEVTKKAVNDAIAHPRDLSYELIDAQQARRALDYLVGFNLSPLLWKKIRRGLSAGRVQSPALRMIVERENEIERFKSREYWTIESDLEKAGARFSGKLNLLHEDKVKQFTITDEKTAARVRNELLESAGGRLRVSKIEKKQRRRQPAAPFITSTLQQEAVRKLNLSAQQAMRIAQQLYEGIDIGDGAVGLITYMRTDSTTLAQEAVDEMRAMISERYGKDKLPDEARQFKTKSKNAQEAHEAIRPTSAWRMPQDIKAHLSRDQFRLYDLIWKRAIACQMKHATIDTVAAMLDCGQGNTFRATGSTIADPGFMELYLEGQDDSSADDDEKTLPPLQEGEEISLLDIRAEQHFTEPPPRFTEASLVKTLEEYGIGRPSTYASIISTLRQREYVEMDKKRFVPTDVGRIVNKFLTEHFSDYVDYDFTARLEDELDSISRGEKDWVPVMKKFWTAFDKQVRDKEENVSRSEASQARELGIDPKTGSPVSVRMGRYGPFVQIGTRDDEEKPKFAGLRPGQRMDTITMEEAMELFKLPRELGMTDEDEEVVANVGRFGPYIRYGKKFVSLKDEDPHTVTLERALELIREKKEFDANKEIRIFSEEEISVLNGRYGPYVTDGTKNARVPKDREPASLTLAECQELLANAPARGRRGKKKTAKKAASKKKTTKKAAAKKTKKKTTKAAKKTGISTQA